LGIGFPAVVTAQIGAYLAELFPPYWLLAAFGILLLINIYLVELRKRLSAKEKQQIQETADERQPQDSGLKATISRIATGSAAGVLAGLFGVGGGVIMVPLQRFPLVQGTPYEVMSCGLRDCF
jgi:uncharacterized membrane protein YfcA